MDVALRAYIREREDRRCEFCHLSEEDTEPGDEKEMRGIIRVSSKSGLSLLAQPLKCRFRVARYRGVELPIGQSYPRFKHFVPADSVQHLQRSGLAHTVGIGDIPGFRQDLLGATARFRRGCSRQEPLQRWNGAVTESLQVSGGP